jgi:cytoskeletal protein CcmA (bactofilin family)
MPLPQTLPPAPAAPLRPHLEIRNAIKGNLKAGSITIHAGAAFSGQIDARSVVIKGSVSGIVRASSIAIGPTGRIDGELHYGLLNIETGAEIAARCIPGRPVEPVDESHQSRDFDQRRLG